MPLNVRVPMGPLVYSRRIGGGSGSPVLYWLFIGFWWVPVKWMVIGVWVLCVFLWRAGEYLVRHFLGRPHRGA